MKVKELIAQLQAFNPEDEVGFVHPANDYWKTALVAGIHNVEKTMVTRSEYLIALADNERQAAQDKEMAAPPAWHRWRRRRDKEMVVLK